MTNDQDERTVEERPEGEVDQPPPPPGFLGTNEHFVFVDHTMTEPLVACEGQEDCPPHRTCFEGRCVKPMGPFNVPDDAYFVLGDNRCNSHDSRFWYEHRGGTVPADDVRGTATIVWMSFDEEGQIRWDRIGADAPKITPLEEVSQRALAVAIRKCMVNRPSNTTPPRP